MAIDEFDFMYLPVLTMKRRILWISLFLLVIQFYSPMPVSILVVQTLLIKKMVICIHGE
jgi:hypothetical protein